MKLIYLISFISIIGINDQAQGQSFLDEILRNRNGALNEYCPRLEGVNTACEPSSPGGPGGGGCDPGCSCVYYMGIEQQVVAGGGNICLAWEEKIECPDGNEGLCTRTSQCSQQSACCDENQVSCYQERLSIDLENCREEQDGGRCVQVAECPAEPPGREGEGWIPASESGVRGALRRCNPADQMCPAGGLSCSAGVPRPR